MKTRDNGIKAALLARKTGDAYSTFAYRFWPASRRRDMLDILKDGPFRYIHSRETGALLLALVRVSTGKFVEEGEEDTRSRAYRERTLREWKAHVRFHWRIG